MAFDLPLNISKISNNEKKVSLSDSAGKVAMFIITILVLAAGRLCAQAPGVKNILLIHGTFADGSGWEGVFKILTAKGYNVTVVQNPCSSLEEDVAAVKRAMDRETGPCILVGHSYGGSVITEAGSDDRVVGLVYVDGFVPDSGETAVIQDPSVPDRTLLTAAYSRLTHQASSILTKPNSIRVSAPISPQARQHSCLPPRSRALLKLLLHRSLMHHGKQSPVGESWGPKTRRSILYCYGGFISDQTPR